jgi:adenine phosphoribosyltransferase
MSQSDILKHAIRDVVDFPRKGIVFKDITPILSDSKLCRYVIEELAERLSHYTIDAVAGIESRGFLFGMSLAQHLNVGFIPLRKKGKLPSKTVSAAYALEYGNAEVEMHKDAVKKGMNIHIHDDLLATGGTAEAAARLIREQGGLPSSFSFIIELESLRGRDKISPYTNIIDALVVY